MLRKEFLFGNKCQVKSEVEVNPIELRINSHPLAENMVCSLTSVSLQTLGRKEAFGFITFWMFELAQVRDDREQGGSISRSCPSSSIHELIILSIEFKSFILVEFRQSVGSSYKVPVPRIN